MGLLRRLVHSVLAIDAHRCSQHIQRSRLQVRRVEINVFVDNSAGIALYQKLGFVEEGRARDYAFRDGRFCDVLMMARVLPS